MKFKNRNGNELEYDFNDVGKNVVVMCHGFSSNRNSKTYTNVANVLAQHNISSFRYDAIGHGESYGNIFDFTVTQSVNDLIDIVINLQDKGYSVSLFGSSAGGMAIIAAMPKLNVRCAVLKAPSIKWLDSWYRKRSPREKWKSDGFCIFNSSRHGALKIGFQLCEDLEQMEDVFETSKTISCPTLIVQGSDDQIDRVEDNRKLHETIPRSRFEVIEGSNHYFHGFEKESSKLVTNFFISHLTKDL